jgi:hypothetical protein
MECCLDVGSLFQQSAHFDDDRRAARIGRRGQTPSSLQRTAAAGPARPQPQLLAVRQRQVRDRHLVSVPGGD